MGDPVVVKVAVNGPRSRAEHPAIPSTPAEAAEEARRCAEAGANVIHLHAPATAGGWRADAGWYGEALRRIRQVAPDLLISLTSLRPAGIRATTITDTLQGLARRRETTPDLITVNLGHIVAWEPLEPPRQSRRTAHFPNDYEDIVALLQTCRALNITPELGVMDIGFISNAVALRQDGLIPAAPWFLIQLDSPAYGAGRQVAPSTGADYEVLASRLREHFPGARWATHGAGQATYNIVLSALDDGAHIRVGFEDALVLPDGRPAPSNADLVTWAVGAVAERDRRPATPAETREIIRGVRRADRDSGV